MNISLAITIPDETKRRLASAIERHADAAVKARWAERDQLQFPIVTVGETATAFLPHLSEAFTGLCAEAKPFPVHVYGFGFFGSKRFPHSVWAAVDPVEEMFEIYDRAWRRIEQFGFTKPTQEFRPHIILGTFRGGVKNRNLIDELDADTDIEFGTWQITRLAIYDCREKKRGRSYRKLDQFPLGIGGYAR